MSNNYVNKHFNAIKTYAGAIENRLDAAYCTLEGVLEDNVQVLELVQENSVNQVLIDDEYKIEIDL